MYLKTKESVRKDGKMGKRSNGDRFRFCAYPHFTCFVSRNPYHPGKKNLNRTGYQFMTLRS